MAIKKIVSVSLGSAARDHTLETELFGHLVTIKRVGTDGDSRLFRKLLLQYDGEVDAIGIGGADLGVKVADRVYALSSVQKLVRGISTPLVDGAAVRAAVEGKIATTLKSLVPNAASSKKVLIGSAVGRYDMALSFYNAGYDIIYGDLAFALGIPVAMRSFGTFLALSKTLAPWLRHLPISLLYPTGEKQTNQKRIPANIRKWYQWADVIADDFHYINQFLPESLEGKGIVTNTLTKNDLEKLKSRGVSYVLTTTPYVNGRSFGTNVIEATLVALAGKSRPLSLQEISYFLSQEPELSPSLTLLA